MSLSESLGAAGLAAYAEAALVLFLLAFVGVVIQVAIKRSGGSVLDGVSSLPLQEDTENPPTTAPETPEALRHGH